MSEGRYRLDWLLRDSLERVCSGRWEFTARHPLGPDTAVSSPQPRTLSLFLHLAPTHPGAATLAPAEIELLLAMLQAIVRDPSIEPSNLTAFQLDPPRLVLRQAAADVPALRTALEHADFLRLDYQALFRPLPLLTTDSSDLTLFLGLKPGPVPALFLSYATRKITAEPNFLPWSRKQVKSMGGMVYDLSRPLDFASAWREIKARLAAQ